jgi:solute carrier family 25 protein 38
MDPATNPVLKAFLAGSLSGTASTILFQPLDLVKTRLQSQQSGNRAHISMLGVARHVLRT